MKAFCYGSPDTQSAVHRISAQTRDNCSPIHTGVLWSICCHHTQLICKQPLSWPATCHVEPGLSAWHQLGYGSANQSLSDCLAPACTLLSISQPCSLLFNHRVLPCISLQYNKRHCRIPRVRISWEPTAVKLLLVAFQRTSHCTCQYLQQEPSRQKQ